MTTAVQDPTIDTTEPPTDPWLVQDLPMTGAGPEPHSSSDAAAGPATPRRRPGPPPDPNSGRQRRAAKKAAKTAPAPGRRAATSRPGADAPAPSGREAGATMILRSAAQMLASAGLALGLAATRYPDGDPRGDRVLLHARACTLDTLTLMVHGPAIARGAAGLADHLPWMAAVLDKAARLAPGAEFGNAVVTMLLQVMCNHGLLPAHAMLGTLDPETLTELAGVVSPSA